MLTGPNLSPMPLASIRAGCDVPMVSPDKMNVTQLKAALKALSRPVGGNKEALRTRLWEKYQTDHRNMLGEPLMQRTLLNSAHWQMLGLALQAGRYTVYLHNWAIKVIPGVSYTRGSAIFMQLMSIIHMLSPSPS